MNFIYDPEDLLGDVKEVEPIKKDTDSFLNIENILVAVIGFALFSSIYGAIFYFLFIPKPNGYSNEYT